MRNRIALLVPLLTLTGLLAFAPAAIPIDWDTLQRVSFEDRFVKEVNGPMLFPKFTPVLKALNGKYVTIKGYVVPFDKTGAKIALSATSYAACFFCGKAGPASVLTVNLKKPDKKFKTDQYRSFTGRMRLNNNDIREFYYILDDAEMVADK